MDITRKTFPGVYVEIRDGLNPADIAPALQTGSTPVPPTPPTPPPEDTVATPTFSPTSETFTGSVDVTILCSTSGAAIHYTTDGSTPTGDSPTFSSPIHVTTTTTIKAIGTKTNFQASAVASSVYTLSLDCPVATTLPALDFPTATTSPSIYKRPSWAAINPTTNIICVLDDVDASIYFVDAITNTQIDEISDLGDGLFTSSSSIIFDSVNNQWVIQHWRDIVFIDGTTRTEISRLANLLSNSSGGNPRLLAYDPATGNIFAISYRNVSSIFTISGASRTVINTTTLPNACDSVVWLPNISKVFVSHGFGIGAYYDPVAHTFTQSTVTGSQFNFNCLYHSGTGQLLISSNGTGGTLVRIVDPTSDTLVGNLSSFGVQQAQDLVINSCDGETWLADQGAEMLFEFNSDMTSLVASFVASNPVGLTFCRRTNLMYYQDAHFYDDYGLHQSVTYPTTDQTDPLYTLSQLGFVTFGNMPNITELTLNVITCIPGIDIESDPTLVKLHCPFLIAIDPTKFQSGYLFISGNSNLTTIELPVFVPNPGDTYDLTSNALLAASVNQFLARCIANPIFVTGTVDLSGGANAAPTGQGITDKATLISRGVTVTTN